MFICGVMLCMCVQNTQSAATVLAQRLDKDLDVVQQGECDMDTHTHTHTHSPSHGSSTRVYICMYACVRMCAAMEDNVEFINEVALQPHVAPNMNPKEVLMHTRKKFEVWSKEFQVRHTHTHTHTYRHARRLSPTGTRAHTWRRRWHIAQFHSPPW